MASDERNPNQSTWTVRRRFMIATTVFCMSVIAYVLITGSETSPAGTAVTMAFFTLSSTIGTYVFGAVWEDNNK